MSAGTVESISIGLLLFERSEDQLSAARVRFLTNGTGTMLIDKPIHVVDDDLGFLKGIERLLGAHGLSVKTYSSVEVFQAEADPNEAACLILDIHLGPVSGIDLLRQLSLAGVDTPVVLITGNDSDQTRTAALAAGCKAYLQKPVSAKVLMEAVSNATGRSLNP